MKRKDNSYSKNVKLDTAFCYLRESINMQFHSIHSIYDTSSNKFVATSERRPSASSRTRRQESASQVINQGLSTWCDNACTIQWFQRSKACGSPPSGFASLYDGQRTTITTLPATSGFHITLLMAARRQYVSAYDDSIWFRLLQVTSMKAFK